MPLCPDITEEYITLLAKKREFDTALKTAEIAKTPEETTAAIAKALALKAELIEGKRALEDKLFVSLETAEEILGKENVLAAEDIEKTYGFKPELPRIPFKRKELEFWKSMNEEYEKRKENVHFRLSYDIDKTNEGEPLTIETLAKLVGNNIIKNPDGTTSHRLYKEQFNDDGAIKDSAWFKNDPLVRNSVPSGQWKITSDEILPKSADLNYLDQTDFLIGFWRTKIFPVLSEEEAANYETLFVLWEKNKPGKDDAITLTNHPVSQTLRESFASTVSRTIILEKTQNKKILKDKYNWSNTPSSDGGIGHFGHFGSDGADVYRDTPGSGWTSHGVVFSRSEILKSEK